MSKRVENLPDGEAAELERQIKEQEPGYEIYRDPRKKNITPLLVRYFLPAFAIVIAAFFFKTVIDKKGGTAIINDLLGTRPGIAEDYDWIAYETPVEYPVYDDYDSMLPDEGVLESSGSAQAADETETIDVPLPDFQDQDYVEWTEGEHGEIIAGTTSGQDSSTIPELE